MIMSVIVLFVITPIIVMSYLVYQTSHVSFMNSLTYRVFVNLTSVSYWRTTLVLDEETGYFCDLRGYERDPMGVAWDTFSRSRC